MKQLFLSSILLLTVIVIPYGSHGADLRKGMEAFKKGDYATAIKEWKPLADQGNNIAQYSLGWMYQSGQGVSKDNAVAAMWYHRAAKNGFAEAQDKLGLMFFNGEGVAKDRGEAAKWYRLAAEQGNANAQFKLGKMHTRNDLGVSKNNTEAVRLYRLAAEQGNANAMFELGQMYSYGKGVIKDTTEGVKLYRQAANKGNALASLLLGHLYHKGNLGLPVDIQKALYWYRLAGKQGNPLGYINASNISSYIPGTPEYKVEKEINSGEKYKKWVRDLAQQSKQKPSSPIPAVTKPPRPTTAGSFRERVTEPKPFPLNVSPRDFQETLESNNPEMQNLLGGLYANGKRVPQDYPKAAVLYRAAAEKGYALAQSNLGMLYQSGLGVPIDPKEAAKWYRKAAEQGNAPAQYFLSLLINKGEGVEKDSNAAAVWLRKSAEQGHRPAEYDLGYAYTHAIGVNRNYAQALFWYKRAAKQGSDVAMNNLSLAFQEGRGVAPNPEEAFRWAKMAAENGNVEAQAKMVPFYVYGKGVKADIKKGAAWSLMVIRRGQDERMSVVAYELLLRLSNEFPRHLQEALNLSKDLFKKYGKPWSVSDEERINKLIDPSKKLTAKKYVAKSWYALGRIFDKGEKISENDAEAAHWYRLAADFSNIQAQSTLAFMYYHGLGVPKDKSLTVHWYRKAADQGLTSAQFYLGRSYYLGEGVTKNYQAAREWFSMAGKGGHAAAQVFLGYMYNFGQSVPKNPKKAVEWFRKAAEQGDKNAQYSLANAFRTGIGASKDFAEAFKWYEKSAYQGNIKAQSALGAMYLVDKELIPNRITGMKWLTIAKSAGEKTAERNWNKMAVKMTATEISEAEKLARKWAKKYNSNKTSFEKDKAWSNEPQVAVEWDLKVSDKFAIASIEGDITVGERQRFVFFKEACESVNHVFSTYTMQPAKFDEIDGKILVIKFNGEKIGAKLLTAKKFLSGHLLMFDLGTYKRDGLLSHLKKHEKISIEFVDGNGIKASDYFDVPRNEWPTSGISDAFENAYQACTQ
jgi:uncharacterized protein